MAKAAIDFTAKLLTTKDGEIEDISFSAGDALTIIKEWQHHYLVKDSDGHFYNLTKDKVVV